MTVNLPTQRITLVLGGARSGKSRYAETLIASTVPPWVYVATAQGLDEEMRARIAAHRARRGPGWLTVEAPFDLVGPLGEAPPGAAVLVDCLTLWLSNLMLDGREVEPSIVALERCLEARRAPTVLVSNEVGLGIVPDNALARRFRDEQGRINQRLAAMADRVLLMVAGLPMIVK